KAAGFVALFRVYFEGMGERAAAWVPIAAGLATITIVAGNLMALPQQNTKRLLAYSGIAHIGYMLVGFAAASASGTAMVLFYLVVAKRMYIEPPAASAGRIQLSRSLALAVILCALGVVALGVYPKPVVMAALRVAAPLF